MRVHIMMVLSALALVGSSGGAQAQKYPSKPVRVIVGFAAGGGTDIAARVIAQKLADAFGNPFVVDNRPGAAGNLAADLIVKSPPDGYAILMANSTIAIPSLFVKLPFDVRKDFTPLSNIALGPSVLSVHPSLPARNVKGLIALARARPGELTYGSGGLGNITHLAMALLTSMANIKMVHAPYKGAAPSLVGLMSGDVQAVFSSIPAALPHVSSGRMRALGVSIAKRSNALPDVPTIAEAGLPGYYAASWYGLLLPAAAPRPVVDALSREVVAVMRVPDVREKMLAQGFEPVGDAPEEFSKFIREEISRWEEVVRNAGIKPE
jgi:tripartite-type tricarboxylate transporter receptor subunit TctC